MKPSALSETAAIENRSHCCVICSVISNSRRRPAITARNPRNQSSFQCDCSIGSEEDCPAPMVWTSGCASCAGGDDGGDESDSATRAVLAAAAVVAALVF